MLSKEGDNRVAFRKGFGVESGPGGKTVIGLGANIVKGDNGGIGGRFVGEVMTKSFTVSCSKGVTQKSSLGEVTVGS